MAIFGEFPSALSIKEEKSGCQTVLFIHYNEKPLPST